MQIKSSQLHFYLSAVRAALITQRTLIACREQLEIHMAKNDQRPFSVSAITQRIGNELADMGPLLIQGELSQFTQSTNGHIYATLKDSEATISVVMWRSTVAKQKELPDEGDKVLVRGSLSVYGPRGSYQLTASSMKKQGQGDLAAQFEQLKTVLENKGFFTQEHKQHLPFLPHAVGIASATGSAALADMLDSLKQRFPAMPVIHAPCQVQGRQSIREIADAIRALDAHPEVDVIICGRGGGSIEDLWSFNEVAVVKAIFECRTPIISAVGHETDTTLADLTADIRAKTPTAAAEMVVPYSADLYQHIEDYRSCLYDSIKQRLQEYRLRWDGLCSHRALAGPAYQLDQRRQRLDELQERLSLASEQTLAQRQTQYQALKHALSLSSPKLLISSHQQQHRDLRKQLQRSQHLCMNQAHEKLRSHAAQLEALSPLAVLQRGYSVIQDSTGKIVTKASRLQKGERISAQLADGKIQAVVE